MNNLLKSVKKIANLQSKTTLAMGAIAASVGGYFVASQLNPSSQPQFTTQTVQTTTITTAGDATSQCQSKNLPSFINHSGVWPGTNQHSYY